MKMTLLLIVLAISSQAMAIDSNKCSALLNDGLWKKYKYMGVGESNIKACTNGTKKDGSSTATSDATTESTTALSDPKYTSHAYTSQTQSTSSWGECSMFADVQRLKEDREQYIVQNESEVLIDLARGKGEHLKVLTFYSACPPTAYAELGKRIQYQMSTSINSFSPKTIASDLDNVILGSEKLKQLCLTNI